MWSGLLDIARHVQLQAAGALPAGLRSLRAGNCLLLESGCMPLAATKANMSSSHAYENGPDCRRLQGISRCRQWLECHQASRYPGLAAAWSRRVPSAFFVHAPLCHKSQASSPKTQSFLFMHLGCTGQASGICEACPAAGIWYGACELPGLLAGQVSVKEQPCMPQTAESAKTAHHQPSCCHHWGDMKYLE